MLVAAVPVVGIALVCSWRAVTHRIAFIPGWWALTFPIGTLARRAFLLERYVEGSPALYAVTSAVAVASLLALCFTWSLCSVASVRALARRRA